MYGLLAVLGPHERRRQDREDRDRGVIEARGEGTTRKAEPSVDRAYREARLETTVRLDDDEAKIDWSVGQGKGCLLYTSRCV